MKNLHNFSPSLDNWSNFKLLLLPKKCDKWKIVQILIISTAYSIMQKYPKILMKKQTKIQWKQRKVNKKRILKGQKKIKNGQRYPKTNFGSQWTRISKEEFKSWKKSKIYQKNVHASQLVSSLSGQFSTQLTAHTKLFWRLIILVLMC